MDYFDRQEEEIRKMVDERRREMEMRKRRAEERHRMIKDDPWRFPDDDHRKFVTKTPEEWWKEEYAPWARGVREESERRGALRRNSRGQVMYSEKCISCKEHVEEAITCDLCNVHQIVERLHANVEPWVEEFPHHCKQAKQMLHNILYAIIF